MLDRVGIGAELKEKAVAAEQMRAEVFDGEKQGRLLAERDRDRVHGGTQGVRGFAHLHAGQDAHGLVLVSERDGKAGLRDFQRCVQRKGETLAGGGGRVELGTGAKDAGLGLVVQNADDGLGGAGEVRLDLKSAHELVQKRLAKLRGIGIHLVDLLGDGAEEHGEQGIGGFGRDAEILDPAAEVVAKLAVDFKDAWGLRRQGDDSFRGALRFVGDQGGEAFAGTELLDGDGVGIGVASGLSSRTTSETVKVVRPRSAKVSLMRSVARRAMSARWRLDSNRSRRPKDAQPGQEPAGVRAMTCNNEMMAPTGSCRRSSPFSCRRMGKATLKRRLRRGKGHRAAGSRRGSCRMGTRVDQPSW